MSVSLCVGGIAGGTCEAVYAFLLQGLAGECGGIGGKGGGLHAVHGFALNRGFGDVGVDADCGEFGALHFGFVAAAVGACLYDDAAFAAGAAWRFGFASAAVQGVLGFFAFGFTVGFGLVSACFAVENLLGRGLGLRFVGFFAFGFGLFFVGFGFVRRQGVGDADNVGGFVVVLGFGFGRRGFFGFARADVLRFGSGLVFGLGRRRGFGRFFRCEDFGRGEFFFHHGVFEIVFAAGFEYVNQAADDDGGQQQADDEAGKAFTVGFLCFH